MTVARVDTCPGRAQNEWHSYTILVVWIRLCQGPPPSPSCLWVDKAIHLQQPDIQCKEQYEPKKSVEEHIYLWNSHQQTAFELDNSQWAGNELRLTVDWGSVLSTRRLVQENQCWYAHVPVLGLVRQTPMMAVGTIHQDLKDFTKWPSVKIYVNKIIILVKNNGV